MVAADPSDPPKLLRPSMPPSHRRTPRTEAVGVPTGSRYPYRQVSPQPERPTLQRPQRGRLLLQPKWASPEPPRVAQTKDPQRLLLPHLDANHHRPFLA